jgi:hypothetical protein
MSTSLAAFLSLLSLSPSLLKEPLSTQNLASNRDRALTKVVAIAICAEFADIFDMTTLAIRVTHADDDLTARLDSNRGFNQRRNQLQTVLVWQLPSNNACSPANTSSTTAVDTLCQRC